MALLVLFPATTRTWLVAADLRRLATHRLLLLRFPRRLPVAAAETGRRVLRHHAPLFVFELGQLGVLLLRLRRRLPLRGLLLALEPQAEQLVGNVGRDAIHHLTEHLEAFLLVL